MAAYGWRARRGLAGVHGAAELGDRVGGHAEGLADGAHDFEGDAVGFAGFERVDGAQGHPSPGGKRALAEQLTLAD